MALTIKRYPDLTGPYLHYGGSVRVWFSKTAWKYFIETPEGLKPLSGVSSLCHVGPQDALIRWAVKKAITRVRERMQEYRRRDGSFYEIYCEELEDVLKDASVADKEALDDAAAVGHIAHAHVEDYIRAALSGDELRACELIVKLPIDERAANCFIAFLYWMHAHNVRFVSTERRVVSLKWGYAGTCDGEAIVDSCDDHSCCSTVFKDQLSVIDHKTSNSLRSGYALQVSSYMQALEEEFPEKKFDARWILRYDKETADFDPWYFAGRELYEQDFETFTHSLQMHLGVDSIDRRVRGMNDQRRALRKALEFEEKMAAWRVECPKAKEYKGVRKSKCFDDGTQCEACAKIYTEKKCQVT